MNLRKAVAALLLIAMGAGVAAAVKNNEGLKEWIRGLSREDGTLSTSLGLNAGDSGNVEETPKVSYNPKLSPEDEVFPPFPSQVELPERSPDEPEEKPVILPTTIEGGMVLRNDTAIEVDLSALVQDGPSQVLPKEGIQVLIIHTHGSEAYTPDETDYYESSDSFRTEDKSKNVVRVGDELAASLESYGISVIHDREIYDYPSYTGSYGRSAAAVERYITEHPEIAVVFDVHRDAIGSDGVVYKTVAEADGKASSQVMLLVGTGENGLAHPNWLENMKLALYLQSAAVNKYTTLMRPIALKKERYNQQMTTGSLILEVGSNGNSLSEALQSVRLFADAVAPALLELVEE